jgi:cell division protein FtsB
VRRFLWIPALLGAVVLYAYIDDEAGVRTWHRLGMDLSASQERIAALQLEIAELRRDAEALESDPAALERAIREDLEFARPGDVVVRLPSVERTNPRIP